MLNNFKHIFSLIFIIFPKADGQQGNSSEIQGIFETHVRLSSIKLPQHVFSLHSNTTEFNFTISKDVDPNLKWKLSIVVEQIDCWGSGNFLEISGPNNSKEIQICESKDFSENRFQSTKFILDDVTEAKVRVQGQGWGETRGLSAKLVANIYHEVNNSCGNCGP